jgi:hypothetical protein
MGMAQRHLPVSSGIAPMTSTVAFAAAADDVAEYDREAADDGEQDECLTPATPLFAAATRPFEHADARREVAILGEELVRGNWRPQRVDGNVGRNRQRLSRWHGGSAAIDSRW